MKIYSYPAADLDKVSSWEVLIHVCASCRLVILVGVEVEMGNIGRWMSRHVLKWRKQSGTLTVVGKESHSAFNVKSAESTFSF